MVAPTTDKFSRNPHDELTKSTVPRPGSCLDYTSLDQENVPGATGRIDLTRVVTITNFWGNCANHLFVLGGAGIVSILYGLYVYCTVTDIYYTFIACVYKSSVW